MWGKREVELLSRHQPRMMWRAHEDRVHPGCLRAIREHEEPTLTRGTSVDGVTARADKVRFDRPSEFRRGNLVNVDPSAARGQRIYEPTTVEDRCRSGFSPGGPLHIENRSTEELRGGLRTGMRKAPPSLDRLRIGPRRQYRHH